MAERIATAQAITKTFAVVSPLRRLAQNARPTKLRTDLKYPRLSIAFFADTSLSLKKACPTAQPCTNPRVTAAVNPPQICSINLTSEKSFAG